MLDYTELSTDGKDFELLIRELLAQLGLDVFWSGRGADGGRDLLADEMQTSFFLPSKKRWLIQCKHNAHAGTSVGISALDDIVDSCSHHNASGYVLMCSTYPSSAVVQRLEGITANRANIIAATFWDAVKIERMLSTPSAWPIAQRFFPKSANVDGWRLHATERPNHWVANYRGYYFHLSNRIGSWGESHLSNASARLAEFESIKMSPNHVIRPRAMYYDDKNCNYLWFLDYLYPRGEAAMYTRDQIRRILKDGHILDDGQYYAFDVKCYEYDRHSDHHDFDHNRYYRPYIGTYLSGFRRDD